MAMSQPVFVNLNSAVTQWAWRLYDRTATWRQKQLRGKETKKNNRYVGLDLDWSDCVFKDETLWETLADDIEESEAASAESQLVTVHGATAGEGAARKPSASILFQTQFTNNTADVQEYTMRTEKTTHSSCTTEVENGYTKGIELGVSLKAPGEVFEANAGYHREFSLSNTQGETFEEELHWGVESLIKVKAHHVAEATLLIKEHKKAGSFVVHTRISGMVYVTFTNIRDNNSFLKSCGGDICDIVDQYVKTERRKGNRLDFVEISDSSVNIRTKGTCKFRYGVKQEVQVTQTELNNI